METTPLFRAPFFNVTGSSVCLGSSSLEKPQNPTFLSLLEYWEKRFWLTEFSHLGGNVNPTVSNLVIVTENIRNNPFDMNELKPMNKNLKTYFHEKIHFTDRYLLNPRHPVTVFVIGAGGTGSQVITNLARMSMALQALGHPGLHVTVFDPDTVSQANIGRQLFSEMELGLNKAVSLVTRINRFFGYAWTAEPQCFPTRNSSEDSTANIIITCTDNIRSRLTLWKFLKKVRKENFSDHSAPIYWMDFGNSQTKGQVIIGTVREKVLQPSSQEYIPMPKMNVITEEVDYAKSRKRNRGRAVLWRKPWKNRICSLTPYWHISDVTCSGKCSRKERHCIAVSMSIWIH